MRIEREPDKYWYEIMPMGHEWERDERGEVNVFAFTSSHCNGPRCVKCGWGFCHHCLPIATIPSCTVTETTDGKATMMEEGEYGTTEES